MSCTLGAINMLLVDDHAHVLWRLKKLIEGAHASDGNWKNDE
jgi:hypothetical protein